MQSCIYPEQLRFFPDIWLNYSFRNLTLRELDKFEQWKLLCV